MFIVLQKIPSSYCFSVKIYSIKSHEIAMTNCEVSAAMNSAPTVRASSHPEELALKRKVRGKVATFAFPPLYPEDEAGWSVL